MPYFFDLTFFKGKGRNPYKNFFGDLVDLKTLLKSTDLYYFFWKDSKCQPVFKWSSRTVQNETNVRNSIWGGWYAMYCSLWHWNAFKKCNNWYIISTWGFPVVFSVFALDWVEIIGFKGKLTLWVLKLDSNSCALLIL